MSRLPGLTLALAALALLLAPSWTLAVAQEDITTGSVHVCGAGISNVRLEVEVQPLAPVVDENPADNRHEGDITICIHE